MKDHWTATRLGNLGNFRNGVNFSSDVMGKGIPLINVKDITGEGFIEIENLDLVDLQPKPAYYAKSGDIFFARSSVKYEGIGEVNICKNLTDPAIHCGFVIRYRITEQKILDPTYLYYFLKTPSTRSYIRGFSSGTAIFNLSQGSLRFAQVVYPPLPTQRKIAALLSAYDDLIENNLRRIALLEEQARLVYEEWFVRFRFPGWEDTPVDDETGLPVGWRREKLENVALLNKSSIKKGSLKTIRYIDISCVSPSQINIPEEIPFSDAPGRARRKVKDGDILWSCVRPNRRSHAVVMGSDSNWIASTGFCVVSPKETSTSFLYQTITTSEFVGYLENMAGGAAYPAVKKENFAEAEVILPNASIEKLYGDCFDKHLLLSSKLAEQNILLREARDLLLPRLMSGIIEV